MNEKLELKQEKDIPPMESWDMQTVLYIAQKICYT